MMAYVYAVVVDGLARYVGKGQGDRAYEHLRIIEKIISERPKRHTRRKSIDFGGLSKFYRRLIKARIKGSKIEVKILCNNLTDGEALATEWDLVGLFKDQLWNTQPGEIWKTPGYRDKVLLLNAIRRLPTRAEGHFR